MKQFRTVVLDYADGPRYLEMVRDESKPDLLAEILKPATAGRRAPSPAGGGRQLEDNPRRAPRPAGGRQAPE